MFINADLIAAGLSPFSPELAAFKAGRLMLQALDEHAARGDSFAFETTLSGRGYAHRLQTWQRHGYLVTLYYLRLQSPELAIARVAERVRQGGHDIPEPVIRRRFDAGLRYFDSLYRPLVDDWMLFDNSGETPILIEWGEKS
ncbi:MAG: zeta toxin family protein [Candidatus Thiodiazotropha sp. (ex Rostrolucina anterorostrata)]|nr:zeta toxin family protein [Candidatus Thiodiazotropha sp. (ex Rostrolucina anterorostrata)]